MYIGVYVLQFLRGGKFHDGFFSPLTSGQSGRDTWRRVGETRLMTVIKKQQETAFTANSLTFSFTKKKAKCQLFNIFLGLWILLNILLKFNALKVI
jgi:hypothetical protein